MLCLLLITQLALAGEVAVESPGDDVRAVDDGGQGGVTEPAVAPVEIDAPGEIEVLIELVQPMRLDGLFDDTAVEVPEAPVEEAEDLSEEPEVPVEVLEAPVEALEAPVEEVEAPVEAPEAPLEEALDELGEAALERVELEEPPPPPEPDDPLPRGVLGAFGAIGTAGRPLGVAPALWLEGGVRLPWLRGRFTPFVRLGGAYSAYDGMLDDPVSYTFAVRHLTAWLAPGLSVRVLPATEGVSPELALAPLFQLHETAVTGKPDGGEARIDRDAGVRVGWVASAGVSARVGRGSLIVWANVDHVRHTAALTGEAGVLTVAVALGFRQPVKPPSTSAEGMGAP